jgi:hypothetical protein
MVTGGTAEHQHRPVGAHDGRQRPVLPRLVRQTKRRHDIPYLWSELVHIRHALRAHADRKGPARAAVSNNCRTCQIATIAPDVTHPAH